VVRDDSGESEVMSVYRNEKIAGVAASGAHAERAHKRNGPVFIVGAPRSGTTLMQYMLRCHPRLSFPTGESHFIVPLYRRRAEFGDLRRPENVRRVLQEMSRRSREFLETDLHGIRFELETVARQLAGAGCKSMSCLIRRLFEANAQGEGKARWGDKTPYYVLHMPALLEMFPDAQILHVIRDGRDCALSLLVRCRDFKVYNTYEAAKYWQYYVDRGQAVGHNLPPDVYHELRYEDLLTEPEATLRGVCAFLGEVYDSALVDFRPSGQQGKTPLLRKPLQGGNQEKWRAGLSPRQLRIFEAAVGATLVRNAYPLATDAAGLSLPVRAAYRLHNKAARRVFGLLRGAGFTARAG